MPSANEGLDFEPERRRRLIRQIEEAFADVPYPGDDHLVESPWYFEAAELQDQLRGKHWREVPVRIMELENPTPMWLTSAALQFYLPAYLIWPLAGDLVDGLHLVFVYFVHRELLDPARDPEDYARECRWDVFTPAQRRAIREFLEFYRDFQGIYLAEQPERARENQREIDLALERYWGK